MKVMFKQFLRSLRVNNDFFTKPIRIKTAVINILLRFSVREKYKLQILCLINYESLYNIFIV